MKRTVHTNDAEMTTIALMHEPVQPAAAEAAIPVACSQRSSLHHAEGRLANASSPCMSNDLSIAKVTIHKVSPVIMCPNESPQMRPYGKRLPDDFVAGAYIQVPSRSGGIAIGRQHIMFCSVLLFCSVPAVKIREGWQMGLGPRARIAIDCSRSNRSTLTTISEVCGHGGNDRLRCLCHQ